MSRHRCCAAVAIIATFIRSTRAETLELSEWRLASTLNVTVSGAVVSTPSYSPTDWYNATLPCTVLACLQQNGLYPNPFFGENFYAIDPFQFDKPWWYRTEFIVPSGATTLMRFRGVNYRADVWVNGVNIATNATTVGAFRHFTFDVSAALAPPGSPNVVAVLVARPHDLAVRWVGGVESGVRRPAGGICLPHRVLVHSRRTSASRSSTGPLRCGAPEERKAPCGSVVYAPPSPCVPVCSPLTSAWGSGMASMLRSSRGPSQPATRSSPRPS